MVNVSSSCWVMNITILDLASPLRRPAAWLVRFLPRHSWRWNSPTARWREFMELFVIPLRSAFEPLGNLREQAAPTFRSMTDECFLANLRADEREDSQRQCAHALKSLKIEGNSVAEEQAD